MNGYRLADFDDTSFSVAMTETLDDLLVGHLDRGPDQEDLCFAYWRPSVGRHRYSAVLHAVILPAHGERILSGNVSFTSDYAARVLDECPPGSGIALLHSHPWPGWQDMSEDDIVAERDRLAGAVAGRTDHPLLGMTWGTDRTWSARFWLRAARHSYERQDAATARVVGRRLRISHHPTLSPRLGSSAMQVATISVWGAQAQEDLARVRVGVVGLGSVGSMVVEALARTGIQHLRLIDDDKIEVRNLDRTLGADADDIGCDKVVVAERMARRSHTSARFDVEAVPHLVQDDEGYAALLDCDVVFSCVDRPWPRHVLNVVANAHLIPVIDGGILAKVDSHGRLVHVDWRIHTVGPGRACLYCLDAVHRGDPALDRDGKLDDPDYVAGLTPEQREQVERRNVFAFSMSVAAHEVLQLVGLVTGNARIGGIGPQTYRAYPGRMDVEPFGLCNDDCDIGPTTALACDPRR